MSSDRGAAAAKPAAANVRKIAQEIHAGATVEKKSLALLRRHGICNRLVIQIEIENLLPYICERTYSQ
jgi:hypothetical protein